MLVGTADNKGRGLGGKWPPAEFSKDLVTVELPSVAGVGYALLGVDDEDVVVGLRVRPVGAPRLIQADFKTRVGRCAGVRAWDVVSLEDFSSACCFGVHEAMCCVRGGLCGRVCWVKMNVGSHEVAAGGVADGVACNFAVAVCFAAKDECAAARLGGSRRRDGLPSPDLELAVKEGIAR